MAERARFSCILWDVDGTLVDASEGILRRLTATLEHFGHVAPTRAELSYWIGPPLRQSFETNTAMSEADAVLAVTYYRQLAASEGFASGAHLIPGIGELVAELAAAGVPQATASSKPENQVATLIEHFGLAPHFVAVVGASADEKTLASKSDVIGEALHRLGVAGADTSRPVLIGDRHHDVEGGAEHGVPVVFVRWGFSWPHEAGGAMTVAETVAELRELLFVTDPDG